MNQQAKDFSPPKRLKIISDNNEIQFTRKVKTGKDFSYEYIYIKSNTKLGNTVSFSEKDLRYFLDSRLFVKM